MNELLKCYLLKKLIVSYIQPVITVIVYFLLTMALETDCMVHVSKYFHLGIRFC